MNSPSTREKLIQFLTTIKRPDMHIEHIYDNDGLVKSGLIDSLAMLEIVTFLESEFDIDFSETGVDPTQLESIQAILALIAQRH
ncbi:MAG: acyl carrier protein [Magnetococcus sp. DMHC-6]